LSKQYNTELKQETILKIITIIPKIHKTQGRNTILLVIRNKFTKIQLRIISQYISEMILRKGRRIIAWINFGKSQDLYKVPTF
jgi:hypothetical protein